MRRYLLVLDKDLITADEDGQSSPEPIRYLAARQEEEPCEVVVLSLVSISQPRLPLFTRSGPKSTSIDQLTRANLGKHDASAAEGRMNSAVHLLEQAGCHAMGVISRQQQLVIAVRAEVRGRHYDEVILVTGRSGPWLARVLGLDPVHRLRMRLGHRLTVFRPGAAAPQAAPVS
jgi:hypothetical protein